MSEAGKPVNYPGLVKLWILEEILLPSLYQSSQVKDYGHPRTAERK